MLPIHLMTPPRSSDGPIGSLSASDGPIGSLSASTMPHRIKNCGCRVGSWSWLSLGLASTVAILDRMHAATIYSSQKPHPFKDLNFEFEWLTSPSTKLHGGSWRLTLEAATSVIKSSSPPFSCHGKAQEGPAAPGTKVCLLFVAVFLPIEPESSLSHCSAVWAQWATTAEKEKGS